MLNKLLKRCMPWMDNGRWYHVEYELDSNNNLTYIKYDNIFDRYEAPANVYDDIRLHIKSDRQKCMVNDYKFLITPNIDRFIGTPNDYGINIYIVRDENNNISDIDITASTAPGWRFEVWLYITEV